MVNYLKTRWKRKLNPENNLWKKYLETCSENLGIHKKLLCTCGYLDPTG